MNFQTTQAIKTGNTLILSTKEKTAPIHEKFTKTIINVKK